MGPFGFIENIGLIQGLFFTVGLLLVIVEMFYPGFGAPGITGLILLIAGIFLTAKSVLDVLILLIIIFAILGAALALVLRSASSGRLSRTLILSDSLKKEAGFSSNENLESFLGKEGITNTILRPAGSADFDGAKLDVVSEGSFIPKGSKVKVIEVSGPRIVVRELTDK